MLDFTYKRISQEEAKKIMDSESKYIILDVRREEEFREGHIKNAINIPNEDILPYELLDLDIEMDTPILVYCRSGHRSLTASLKLSLVGYKDIYEFGGILTWPYEIVQ